MRYTLKVFHMLPMKRLILLMLLWKPSAIRRTGRRQNFLENADVIQLTRVACGIKAFCTQTVARVGVERAGYLEVDNTVRLDWDALKAQIARYGMRNSNCVAIAPTATIFKHLLVCHKVLSRLYQNLYVKSNLSGEFVREVNEALVRDLKALDLWDEVMVSDLKYFDGSLTRIERVPEILRRDTPLPLKLIRYGWLKLASRRQKWIDQAQSLNIYLAQPSGEKAMKSITWLDRGFKRPYYLRTLGASQVEKLQVVSNKLRKKHLVLLNR